MEKEQSGTEEEKKDREKREAERKNDFHTERRKYEQLCRGEGIRLVRVIDYHMLPFIQKVHRNSPYSGVTVITTESIIESLNLCVVNGITDSFELYPNGSWIYNHSRVALSVHLCIGLSKWKTYWRDKFFQKRFSQLVLT